MDSHGSYRTEVVGLTEDQSLLRREKEKDERVHERKEERKGMDFVKYRKTFIFLFRKRHSNIMCVPTLSVKTY